MWICKECGSAIIKDMINRDLKKFGKTCKIEINLKI